MLISRQYFSSEPLPLSPIPARLSALTPMMLLPTFVAVALAVAGPFRGGLRATALSADSGDEGGHIYLIFVVFIIFFVVILSLNLWRSFLKYSEFQRWLLAQGAELVKATGGGSHKKVRLNGHQSIFPDYGAKEMPEPLRKKYLKILDCHDLLIFIRAINVSVSRKIRARYKNRRLYRLLS